MTASSPLPRSQSFLLRSAERLANPPPTTQPHNDTTIRLSDYQSIGPPTHSSPYVLRITFYASLLHSFRGINKKLTLIPLTGHPLTIQAQNFSPSPHLFFYLFLEINSFPTHPSPIINQQSSILNLLFLFLFLRIKSPPFHSRIRHGSPFVHQE
jgi:hypothetical protein